ncbi:hypothetical protein A2617_02920 [Candidatus Daviesbacteria bacterium RIFOXYD1_FULL_41_10]|uniref:VWFA domain-containing protein n=2 Tax=Candidatus Daviesiibacteriota TaxID=1752718 RepID=A0A1F5N3A2_9BACT|nr:MAG: hypothetical protein A2617_02920 [Candidatus Daviesbacteria bacterium RIFOXYD1_FULL_41_10]
MATDMQPEREGESQQRLEDQSPGATDRINRFLQTGWNSALQTDQFEIAEAARGQVSSLKNWRDAAHRSPFPEFYQLIEAGTLLNQASATPTERAAVVDQLSINAQHFPPRVRDLYTALLTKLDGSTHTPNANEEIARMTDSQLKELEESGDLRVLQNPFVPWNVKLNRMETRIESELKGRRDLDKRDKRLQEATQQTEAPKVDRPPDARDESKPGMDEMQRLKEGEQAPAIWSISPAYGGYYKEQSFDTWDAHTNTWRQSKYDFKEPYISPDDLRNPQDPVVMTAIVPAGRSARLPSPYTYEYLQVLEGNGQVLIDQNDDFIVRSTSRQDTLVKIQKTAIEKEHQIVISREEPQVILIPSTFTEETEEKLKEVQNTRKTTNDKARALSAYTRRHLKYSNDSSLNSVYNSDSDGYAGSIDKHKMADCDVANTYFAALCAKLGIKARHAVGHMVKGKDSEGNARITSGTGHAWTEVYDEHSQKWIKIDATPPGDPQLEQDEQGEGIPGDYGDEEAIGPTDEELQQLEEKLSQVAENLSYTDKERQLAEATGVGLKKARQILKEIQEAEETRLPNGERIVDVLSQVWTLLAESRIRYQQEYTGPVRKREGGEEIDDIVAHKIGITAGETDPASRRREQQQVIVEQVMSALQVRIIGDKSGSMGQTVDGVTKWNLQRRAMYLILSSLDRAEKNFVRVKARMREPLDVYSQVISFRNKSDIDEDKPLSNEFSPENKVRLWKSLGNQGFGNGDVPALNFLLDQIQKEQEEIIAQGKKDNTLRVIIACSDGMPDDPAGVQQTAQKLGEFGAVVVGVGLTETASQVPIIFNTPHSSGDLARDLNDLPAIVAKHVVMEAIKLFPERARMQYQRAIESILAKFNHIGLE